MHERVGVADEEDERRESEEGDQRQLDAEERQLDRLLEEQVLGESRRPRRSRGRAARKCTRARGLTPTAAASSTACLIASRSSAFSAIFGSSRAGMAGAGGWDTGGAGAGSASTGAASPAAVARPPFGSMGDFGPRSPHKHQALGECRQALFYTKAARDQGNARAVRLISFRSVSERKAPPPRVHRAHFAAIPHLPFTGKGRATRSVRVFVIASPNASAGVTIQR